MAIEAAAPSTALIQNDAVVMGLLAATLAFVFWGASRPSGLWKKFYAVVPALLMCYLLPAISVKKRLSLYLEVPDLFRI